MQLFQASSSGANIAEMVDYVLHGARERKGQKEQKSKGREGGGGGGGGRALPTMST